MNDPIITQAVAQLTEPTAEQTSKAISNTREALLAEIAQMDSEAVSPRRSLHRRVRSRFLPFTVGVATCMFLALGISWSFLGPARSYAYSQIVDAIQEAKTVHYVTQEKVGGEWSRTREVWYSKTQGLYEWQKDGRGAQLRIDNGERLWVNQEGADEATVGKSVGATGMVEHVLKPLELPVKFTRDYSKDRTVGGASCRCYSAAGDAGELHELWVDAKERLRVARASIKVGGSWEERYRCSVWYDLPIEASRFRPSFSSDVRVVDLTEVFGELFPLEEAVYRTSKHGYDVGVHQLRSVAPSVFLAVVSIRPTAQTRKSVSIDSGRSYAQFAAVKNNDLHNEGVHQKPMLLSHFEADGINVEAYLFKHTHLGQPFSPTKALFTIEIMDNFGVVKSGPLSFDLPLPSIEPQSDAAASTELQQAMEELYTSGLAVEQLPVERVQLTLAPRAPNEKELRERAAISGISVQELRDSKPTLVPRIKPSETNLQQFVDAAKRRIESNLPE